MDNAREGGRAQARGKPAKAKPAKARKATPKTEQTQRSALEGYAYDYQLYGQTSYVPGGVSGGYSGDPEKDPGRVRFKYDPGCALDSEPSNAAIYLAEDAAPVFRSKIGVDLVVGDIKWEFDNTAEVEADEERWAAPRNGKPIRLLDLSQAAAYTGVKEHWIRQCMVVPFPRADATLGWFHACESEDGEHFEDGDGTEGWLRSTLDSWIAWPSLGRRTNRPLRILDRRGIAYRLGLPEKALAGIELPHADFIMNRRKGWRLQTIDQWSSDLKDGPF